MKQAALASLLAVAAASPAFSQDETIGVRWREWKVNIGGHIQGQGDVIPSGDIDVDHTLGYDDQENGHELQLCLSIPVLGRFYAGYWWVDFAGSETLTQTITFADRVFTAGTTIESELNLDMYYLTYEFLLPSLPLGAADIRLDIGIQLGARALVAEGSIENSLFSAEDSGGTGIPVVGVHAALQVTPFLRAEVEFAGMAASYASTSLSYVEGFAEIVGQIGPVFAGVGYKWASLDLEDDRGDVDLDVNIKLDGFYLTAGARF